MNLKLWSYGILLPVILVLSASLCGAEEMEGGLSRIRESGIDCTVMLHEDVPEEELIRQVAEGTIEITIADSNIAQLNRRYYPNIKIGIPIAEPQGLGWAVRKGDKALIKAINGFFNEIKSDDSFDDIYKSYYGNVQVFDRLDVTKFHRRIKRRLPKYEPIIKILVYFDILRRKAIDAYRSSEHSLHYSPISIVEEEKIRHG